VVAGALAVAREAGLVRLEVGQTVEPRADVGLQQAQQGLEILPVGAVVAGQEDRGVEAERVRLSNMEANVFEVLNIIP
jgi:hypothetical protein